MYTDADLDAAVASGAMTPAAAAGLRGFTAAQQAGPAADEEPLRLVTSFNDVFVTIAIGLVLVAMNLLMLPFALLGPPLTAAACWGLAEYFTRRRRMALPSIVLVLAFVLGVTLTAAVLAGMLTAGNQHGVGWTAGAVTCTATVAGAIGAHLHWRRFQVPISVAAGTLAAAACILSAAIWAFPALLRWYAAILLVTGLCVFAFAMWWDAGDRLRRTRRSDAAFWLHLLASPLTVHPIFLGFGLLSGVGGLSGALVAIGCYGVLAIIALTVDRRASLVSSLIYVLWATASLLSAADTLGTPLPLAALGIGTWLLVLSASWQRARRLVLHGVPRWVRDRVPAA